MKALKGSGGASSAPYAPDARRRGRRPRPEVFIVKEWPAFRTRDNEAGCAVTSFSAFNLVASFDIVISGLALIHSSRAVR